MRVLGFLLNHPHTRCGGLQHNHICISTWIEMMLAICMSNEDEKSRVK
jgi:hypothetical protein